MQAPYFTTSNRLEKFNVIVNVLLFTLLLLIRSGIGSVMLDIFRFKGFMFTSGVRWCQVSFVFKQ